MVQIVTLPQCQDRQSLITSSGNAGVGPVELGTGGTIFIGAACVTATPFLLPSQGPGTRRTSLSCVDFRTIVYSGRRVLGPESGGGASPEAVYRTVSSISAV